MGYQESLVVAQTNKQFDRLVNDCKKLSDEGFYNDPCTVMPMSVIVLKQRINNLPAGTKALWVVGDRCFHRMSCLLPQKQKASYTFSNPKFIAAEEAFRDKSRELAIDFSFTEGIDFSDSTKKSENAYMKRFTFENYHETIKRNKGRER